MRVDLGLSGLLAVAKAGVRYCSVDIDGGTVGLASVLENIEDILLPGLI